MKFISIIALKGGVGKTVTTINLAANMARVGVRVLVIDADPQCNTTTFFGADPDDGGTEELLTGMADYYPEIVQETKHDNLDVIPASTGLIGLDANAILGREKAKARALYNLRVALDEDDAYDVVLVDCPPGFTAASIAAIYASDLLIVPTQLDKLSLDGWRTLDEQISDLGRVIGHTPEMRCLITMRDRTELARQMEPMLRDRLGCAFGTAIRRSPKVPEALLAGQPLYQYSPTCAAARDYDALTLELALEQKIRIGGGEDVKV